MSESRRTQKPRHKSQRPAPEHPRSRAESTPALAQTAGNRSHSGGPAISLLAAIQTKVVIGAVNDPYEREADAVAASVTANHPAPAITRLPPGGLQSIHRQANDEDELTETVQEESIQRQPEPEETEEVIQEQPIQRQEDEEENAGSIQELPLQRESEEPDDGAEPVQEMAVQRQTDEEREATEETSAEEPIQEMPVQRQEEEDGVREDEAEEAVQAFRIQRQEEPEESEAAEEPVQTQATPGTGRRQSPMSQAAGAAIRGKGPGAPMAQRTRTTLEGHLGVDLSEVRIHEDSSARHSATAIKARAFTHGRDIWLGPGESQDDLELMSHETTHVLQQDGIVRRKPVEPADEEQTEERTEETTDQVTPDEAVPLVAGAVTEIAQPDDAEVDERRTEETNADVGTQRPVEEAASVPAAGSTVTPTPTEEERATPEARSAEVAKEREEQRPSAEAGLVVPEQLPAAAPGVLDAATPAESLPMPGAETEAGTPTAAQETRQPAEGEPPTMVPTAEQPQAAAAARTPESPAPAQEDVAPVAEEAEEVRPAETARASAPAQSGASPTPAPGTAGGVAGGPEPALPTTPAPRAPAGAAGGGAGRGGAGTTPAVATSFNGEPSEIIAQFRRISPVRAPFAFNGLKSSMQGSTRTRRATEEANHPRTQIRPQAPGLGTGRSGERGEGAERPVQGELPQLSGQMPTPERVEEHEHAGAAPEVRGVEDPSRELAGFSEENEEGFFGWIRGWLRRFFTAIPTSDSGASTDPGRAPGVELTGRANPGQIDTLQADSQSQIAEGMAGAEDQRTQDFGEYDIAPDAEEEELEAPLPQYHEPDTPTCAPEDLAEPLNFDPEHEDELSQRARTQYAGRFDTERQRLAGAEQERDREISSERAGTDRAIESSHTDSYGQQTDAARQAQEQTRQLRQEWGEENRQIEESFGLASDQAGREARTDITTHATNEESSIDAEYRKTQQQAEQERRRVEGQAQEERRRQREESDSWFTRGVRWLKNKARDAFRAVTQRIKQWFKDLRNRIKKWFDDLKAWALRKIEEARQWVINKLEGLRTRLKGLVDRYLGQFPGVARFFNRAIDGAINFAQRTVNAAAEGLKRAVSFYLDALAAIIDFHLAVLEGLVVMTLSALCDLTVLGFNLIILLVEQDIDALIELIRDLPEHPPLSGPLMGIVKAGLIGYLERIRDKPADEKKRYVEKTRWLVISPAYYAGFFAGILKGFVWDGLFGIVRMLYELVTGIPDAIKSLYDLAQRLLTDVEAIQEILSEAQAVWADLQSFIARPDAIDQIVAYIKRSPSVLLAMIDQAYKEGKNWAYRAGGSAADSLFKWILNSSHFDIGLGVGSVVGQIIFEAVLLYFTLGAGTAVKLGGKALQMFMRGVNWMLKGIQRGGRLILQALSSLQRVANAGFELAKRIGGALRGIFTRLQLLFARITAWFRRVFQRRRRPRDRGDSRERDRRLWRQFKLMVKRDVAPHRRDGIARGRLQEIVQRHHRPVRRAVILAPISQRRNFYHVRAAMRPYPPRSILSVRRLPTGNSRSDPIPIDWFKPPGSYPSTVTLTPDVSKWGRRTPPPPQTIHRNTASEIEVPPTQIRARTFGTRQRITLGIAPQLWPRPGKVIHRIESPARSMEGKFRNLLKNYGFLWANFAPDHVQDLGWRGPDSLRNLWPLNSSLNTRANRVYDQRVRYEDNNQMRTGTPSRLMNRWFQIRSIRNP
jgi:hypothetical protein